LIRGPFCVELVSLFIWVIQQVPSADIIDIKLFLRGETVRMNFCKQGTPFPVASWFGRLELLPVDVFLSEVFFEG
jgi:hypothetical protein